MQRLHTLVPCHGHASLLPGCKQKGAAPYICSRPQASAGSASAAQPEPAERNFKEKQRDAAGPTAPQLDKQRSGQPSIRGTVSRRDSTTKSAKPGFNNVKGRERNSTGVAARQDEQSQAPSEKRNWSSQEIAAYLATAPTLWALTDRAERHSPLDATQLDAALGRAVKLALRGGSGVALSNDDAQALAALLADHRDVLADAGPVEMASVVKSAGNLRLKLPNGLLDPVVEAMWLWDPADPGDGYEDDSDDEEGGQEEEGGAAGLDEQTAQRLASGARTSTSSSGGGAGAGAAAPGGAKRGPPQQQRQPQRSTEQQQQQQQKQQRQKLRQQLGPRELSLMMAGLSQVAPAAVRRHAEGFLEALDAHAPALTPKQVHTAVCALARVDAPLDDISASTLLRLVGPQLAGLSYREVGEMARALSRWRSAALLRSLPRRLMSRLLLQLPETGAVKGAAGKGGGKGEGGNGAAPQQGIDVRTVLAVVGTLGSQFEAFRRGQEEESRLRRQEQQAQWVKAKEAAAARAAGPSSRDATATITTTTAAGGRKTIRSLRSAYRASQAAAWRARQRKQLAKQQAKLALKQRKRQSIQRHVLHVAFPWWRRRLLARTAASGRRGKSGGAAKMLMLIEKPLVPGSGLPSGRLMHVLLRRLGRGAGGMSAWDAMAAMTALAQLSPLKGKVLSWHEALRAVVVRWRVLVGATTPIPAAPASPTPSSSTPPASANSSGRQSGMQQQSSQARPAGQQQGDGKSWHPQGHNRQQGHQQQQGYQQRRQQQLQRSTLPRELAHGLHELGRARVHLRGDDSAALTAQVALQACNFNAADMTMILQALSLGVLSLHGSARDSSSGSGSGSGCTSAAAAAAMLQQLYERTLELLSDMPPPQVVLLCTCLGELSASVLSHRGAAPSADLLHALEWRISAHLDRGGYSVVQACNLLHGMALLSTSHARMLASAQRAASPLAPEAAAGGEDAAGGQDQGSVFSRTVLQRLFQVATSTSGTAATGRLGPVLLYRLAYAVWRLALPSDARPWRVLLGTAVVPAMRLLTPRKQVMLLRSLVLASPHLKQHLLVIDAARKLAATATSSSSSSSAAAAAAAVASSRKPEQQQQQPLQPVLPPALMAAWLLTFSKRMRVAKPTTLALAIWCVGRAGVRPSPAWMAAFEKRFAACLRLDAQRWKQKQQAAQAQSEEAQSSRSGSQGQQGHHTPLLQGPKRSRKPPKQRRRRRASREELARAKEEVHLQDLLILCRGLLWLSYKPGPALLSALFETLQRRLPLAPPASSSLDESAASAGSAAAAAFVAPGGGTGQGAKARQGQAAWGPARQRRGASGARSLQSRSVQAARNASGAWALRRCLLLWSAAPSAAPGAGATASPSAAPALPAAPTAAGADAWPAVQAMRTGVSTSMTSRAPASSQPPAGTSWTAAPPSSAAAAAAAAAQLSGAALQAPPPRAAAAASVRAASHTAATAAAEATGAASSQISAAPPQQQQQQQQQQQSQLQGEAGHYVAPLHTLAGRVWLLARAQAATSRKLRLKELKGYRR